MSSLHYFRPLCFLYIYEQKLYWWAQYIDLHYHSEILIKGFTEVIFNLLNVFIITIFGNISD